MSEPVKIIFLGGLGEIGRNCFCLEIEGKLLVVDCGLMFPTDDMPGVDLVLPDFSFLHDRADDLVAVVLTHGHEDHIGALPFLLKSVAVPIYGTDLSLALLKPKLEEARVLNQTDLRPFGDGEIVDVGPFRFQAIPVTHSTPHACGFAFYTPQGTICHTGDFKLDQTPVDGRLTDLGLFGALGQEGVRLLLSDSTNAEAVTMTASESVVGQWLSDIFSRCQDQRLIVACFASHLHRVEQVCLAAARSGRKIAFLGRSMKTNTALALEMGLLQLSNVNIIDISEVNQYRPDEVCIVCTGSQGEPLAALSLMAAGEHKFVKVGAHDTVVISASPIPGNEMSVHRSIDGLMRAGAEVIHSGIAKVHVSGHAGAPELQLLLALIRPEFFIPVHGEYRHLVAHKNLALNLGMASDDVVLAQDGDVIELTDEGIAIADESAPAGYVYVDGSGIGDVTNGVLRDRRALADDGVLICVVGVDSHTGEVTRGPELFSRGFLAPDEFDKFADEAADLVVQSIERAANERALDLTTLNRHVRQSLARFANARTQRRPIVFPLVVEV